MYILFPQHLKKRQRFFIEGTVDACFTYESYLNRVAEKGDEKFRFNTVEDNVKLYR